MRKKFNHEPFMAFSDIFSLFINNEKKIYNKQELGTFCCEKFK